MHQDVKEILYTQQQLEERIKVLGEKITADYQGNEVVVLGLLKGSVPFMAQLCKSLDLPVTMDFMHISSYDGVVSREIKIKKDMEQDVEGKHVLIVEDIIDTGKTLKNVKAIIENRGAASVKIVTMLDKHECRQVDIEADYVGFTIPNAFVVGYGLDFDENYRQLPYVGILKESCYE